MSEGVVAQLRKLQSALIDVFRKERYYKMSAPSLAKELLENHVDYLVQDAGARQQRLQDLWKERPRFYKVERGVVNCRKIEEFFEKVEKELGIHNE